MNAGQPKTEYLASADAGRKAQEFLAGATTVADIAGRLTALVVMARYAKEDCVANSNRSFYALRAGSQGGLPWSGEVICLVEQVAEERLPEHLTAHVREERDRRQETRRAEQRATDAATELRGRLDDLTIDERLQALRAFDEQHGRHSVVAHWLRQDILRRNAEDARVHEPEPGQQAPSVDGEPTADADIGDSDVDGELAAAA